MKKQHSIGVALLLAASALIYFSASFGFVNWAASMGETLGTTMVVSVVALLLMAATPLRKKTSAMLVIGFIYFAVSGWNASQNYQRGVEQRQTVVRVNSMIDQMQSGEEIDTQENTPGSSLLAAEMQQYLANVQRINSEYLQAAESSGFATALTPETLTNMHAATDSKKKLNELLKVIPVHQKKLLDQMNTFEQKMASSSDPDMQSALAGYQEGKQRGIDQNERYFAIQTGLVESAIGLIDLAISLEDKLLVQDGQLMFPDQQSLDAYNSGLEAVNRFVEAEQRYSEDQQQWMESKQDQLNSM